MQQTSDHADGSPRALKQEPERMAMSDGESADVGTLIDKLPNRQRQTLEALLVGESEKQVAQRLDISPHTVHDYVKCLHRHFKVHSRAELLAKCLSARS